MRAARLGTASATVVSTLALAEETRTGNLIAWAQVRLARNLNIDDLTDTIEGRLGL
jgi:hypothetical protein